MISMPGSGPVCWWSGWPGVVLAEVALRRGSLARAAQRAAAAIDAGAGPSGHELAGWTAYYQRRPAVALRFAERGAATAIDPDTRARCTALAGRIRHSLGDL